MRGMGKRVRCLTPTPSPTVVTKMDPPQMGGVGGILNDKYIANNIMANMEAKTGTMAMRSCLCGVEYQSACTI